MRPDERDALRTPSTSSRKLAIVTGVVFVVSVLFPVVASLAPVERLPSWVGWIDVTIAFAVVTLGVALDIAAKPWMDAAAERSAFRAYRAFSHVFLVLLVIFLVADQRIEWNVLLPGLAWRAWLFAYVLPAGIAVLRPAEGPARA